MIRLFSKKFFILFLSACIACTGIILACADSGEEEYGNSSFTPEAFADSVYRPFFYSSMFYYSIGHDDTHNTRFNQAIVNDWYAYLGAKVPRSELEYLLENANLPQVDSVGSYMTGGPKLLPPALQSFTLFGQKGDKKIAAFLAYLPLAKKCELFAVNDIPNFYDDDSTKHKKKVFNATRINAALQQGLSKEPDPFMKERYWFQLERSHFFNAAPQQAIDLFDAQQSNFAKNTLYYRTMAYAAGAYHKLKNYSKANYYYSRVYDGSNELKTVAHYSFHPQEEADWRNTLALCKSNEEKATLWQMLGVFYSDEKRAIREIYALNPKSEKLDLLLTRLVNIQEEKAFVHAAADIPERDSAVSLVSGIADAGNTGKPWFWHIAAGYLHMLDKHYYKAKTYYSLAEKNLPAKGLPRLQLRLLKAVNTLASASRVDGKLENQLLPDIQWLKGFDEASYPGFRYTVAFAWIKTTLAEDYRAQKEYVKALCFSNTAPFYADNSNVEAMKSFLDKPGKTPYEQLCADLYVMKKADLLQYQATRLAYSDKLPEAIAAMQQAGDNAAGVLPGNPFNGRVQDCHDCDHEAAQKVKYTRLSLLQKMKEMEDKIAASDNSYTNAVLLGNAFYNISHYGNARFFYEGPVIGEGHYSPFAIDRVFEDFLVSMNMAVKYYTLALSQAQTDEQKAKCNWMLAKCQRNQWYNLHFFNDSKNDSYDVEKKPDYSAIPAYKALRQYANTQYYKDVIKECGYFRDYNKKQVN